MVLILINYDNSIVRLLVRYASLPYPTLPYPTLPYPSGTLRERERCANALLTMAAWHTLFDKLNSACSKGFSPRFRWVSLRQPNLQLLVRYALLTHPTSDGELFDCRLGLRRKYS